jgi:SAM-dependent methyltransferase
MADKTQGGISAASLPVRARFARLLRLIPRPSTNYAFQPIRPSPYDLLPPNPVIYDVGGRNARGRYSFGPPPRDSKIICVDLVPEPGVDIVADAHDLSIVPSGSVDCVLLVQMLTYCHTPQRVVDEAFRILRPGGILYIGAAFLLKMAPDPADYYRFTPAALVHLCRQFEVLASGSTRGPASTMCDLLIRYLALLLCCNRDRLYGVLVEVFRCALAWTKHFDRIIAHWRVAQSLYGNSYVVARKPG